MVPCRRDKELALRQYFLGPLDMRSCNNFVALELVLTTHTLVEHYIFIACFL